MTLAFYKVPLWTSAYTGSFSSELGEVAMMTVGGDTVYAITEFGVVIDIVSDGTDKYMPDSLFGVVVAFDTAKLILELSYIYQPVYLVNDEDVSDIPDQYQYLIVYGVLREAFGRESQGQNPKLEARYKARWSELRIEWFARCKEWARGPDQVSGMLQQSYSNELDWTMRIWR